MEKEGSGTERSYWLLTNRGRLQLWNYWAAAVCNHKPGLYHQVSFFYRLPEDAESTDKQSTSIRHLG